MQNTKPLMILSTGETPVALYSTGDKGTMTIFHPMNIVQIGVIITTAGGGGTLTLAFDRRPTPGSDTGRVAADLGAVTKASASIPIGKVLKKDVNIKVDKGDQIVAKVTAALTTTGDGIAYVMGYAAGEACVEYDRADPPVTITVDSD